MLLHIALQDGFREDTVRIEAAGREIYRKQGVTSKTQIGYADSVEVELAAPTELKIQVETRHASQTCSLPPHGPIYVGVSLTSEGQFDIRFSREPFGYL